MEENRFSFLTIDEVASITGYKKSYVYKMTSQSIIPHFKLNGGKLRFREDDILQWMQSSRVQTVAEIESDIL